jgi:general secretion pathway protein E
MISAMPISDKLLREAEAEAKSTLRPLLMVLESKLDTTPEAFVTALAARMHYPVASMAALIALAPDFSRIPFTEASRRHCLALVQADGTAVAVVADPFNRNLLNWVSERMGPGCSILLAHHNDIAAFLAKQEESLRAMDNAVTDNSGASVAAENAENLSLAAIAEDASPVVRLVSSTLYDALKSGASDVHLESDGSGMTIKYRIDGVLNTVTHVAGLEKAEQAISRIKVMSDLDISERRIPQDGRFQVLMQGREVDFRVSIMPSVHGEDAVLRILDRQALSNQLAGLSLDNLGFDAESLMRFRKLCREPYGMVLVTGPTGSGKTTTLYAALTEIHSGRDKIITIEDPVEYQLHGMLQIPVNEKKGLTFARGLRSILRHDPDKIMVGEIRDADTAQIAVQSALTGHLVLTTVHANNVFDVIGRFLQLGVDGYSFVSALNGIMAQRLVRINCPHCTQAFTPSAALLGDSGIDANEAAAYRFMAGQGCGHCRGSGYKGRKAIAEMLLLNDELRELIASRAPIRSVKEAAGRQGTRSLRQTALALVRNGETTLEEINRVTFVS